MTSIGDKASIEDDNPVTFIEFLKESVDCGWRIVEIQTPPNKSNTYKAKLDKHGWKTIWGNLWK